MDKPITVASVAAELGVSRTRVIALDGLLRPRRCECGGRIYARERVDEVAGERSVSKGTRR